MLVRRRRRTKRARRHRHLGQPKTSSTLSSISRSASGGRATTRMAGSAPAPARARAACEGCLSSGPRMLGLFTPVNKIINMLLPIRRETSSSKIYYIITAHTTVPVNRYHPQRQGARHIRRVVNTAFPTHPHGTRSRSPASISIPVASGFPAGETPAQLTPTGRWMRLVTHTALDGNRCQTMTGCSPPAGGSSCSSTGP